MPLGKARLSTRLIPMPCSSFALVVVHSMRGSLWAYIYLGCGNHISAWMRIQETSDLLFVTGTTNTSSLGSEVSRYVVIPQKPSPGLTIHDLPWLDSCRPSWHGTAWHSIQALVHCQKTYDPIPSRLGSRDKQARLLPFYIYA